MEDNFKKVIVPQTYQDIVGSAIKASESPFILIDEGRCGLTGWTFVVQVPTGMTTKKIQDWVTALPECGWCSVTVDRA